MKIELKEFQEQRTQELLRKFNVALADYSVSGDDQALALSAPTGSGKTVIATAFIERVLLGSEDTPGDEDFVFLWLTDQPQLNEQTSAKMVEISDLDADRIVTISDSFNGDRLKAGEVYFLNTQKLGANSSLVTPGDGRTCTLWEAINNTINTDPAHFVLIIDEAHRGMKDAKADPEFATTIVQRFIKGSTGSVALTPVPMIIGISATIQRFNDLLGSTDRTPRKVDVSVDEVRLSGLVKDLTRLQSAQLTHHTDMTMLTEAIGSWREFQSLWGQYAASQKDLALLDPILLVQVEDGTGKTLTKSPLADILETIYKKIEPASSDWIAHSFQTGVNIAADEFGYPVRYIAPSKIDSDPDVRVVLFKSSLNTGWDCPRAEVMVSFRTAKDPTSIAQLVGRMVRARLAKQIIKFQVLNTTLVYLPKYNRAAVKSVIDMLNGTGGDRSGSEATDEDELVWLERSKAPLMGKAFELLDDLPSMLLPAKAAMPPIDRLYRLAGLLAETKFDAAPVEHATTELVAHLMAAWSKRDGKAPFEEAVKEASSLTLVGHEHQYGQTKPVAGTTGKTVALVAGDLDGRYVAAEQSLGSHGLANAYMDQRLAQGATESRVQAEFYTLAFDGSVLPELRNTAQAISAQWLNKYRTQLGGLKETDEDRYLRYMELLAATEKPDTVTVELSEGDVQYPKDQHPDDAVEWARHMYVRKDDHKFVESLGSSWERKVMQSELQDPNVVAWFRNPARASWSLRVVYQSGTEYTPFYPDLILFRKNHAGDPEPQIVDPHLLSAAESPERARGLALYAADHQDKYRRIDLIIVVKSSNSVFTIKRLNLIDPPTREQVAKVTSTAHLQALFDNAPLYE